jgi:hypothetical protein
MAIILKPVLIWECLGSRVKDGFGGTVRAGVAVGLTLYDQRHFFRLIFQ